MATVTPEARARNRSLTSGDMPNLCMRMVLRAGRRTRFKTRLEVVLIVKR